MVAVLLMVGLAIGGAATIAVVYTNSLDDAPSVASSETKQEYAGSSNGGALTPSTLTTEIVQLNQNAQTGTISSVKVSVTNNGNTTIYVQSASVSAGAGSSNAEWQITSVEGATPVDANGGSYEPGEEFGGYAIAPGQTATFTVSETSGNPVNQIPQDQANLVSVNLKAGDQPGINNLRISSSSIALEDPMAPIEVRAALLYYGGKTEHSQRAWQNLFQSSFFEGSMRTKNIDFQFDKNADSYDFKRMELNATELAENYDVVVIAMWAVHNNIADVVSQLYSLGVPMVFYGSIHKFHSEDINFDVTAQVVGLAPITDADGDAEDLKFTTQSDPINVLSGMDLSNLPALEDDDHIEIDEDDLANATDATPIVYATSEDDVTVTALAFRDGSARVVSSPLDPHDAGHDAEAVFELALPRNMLMAAIDEGQRLTQEGSIQFESISFETYRRDDHKIRPTIEATVQDGDINLLQGDITFEFSMPAGMDFDMSGHSKARIQIESSGMSRTYVSTERIEKDGNVLRFSLEMDHHRNHRGDRSLLYLFEGDNITITFPVRSSHSLKWMEIDEDVDLSAQFDWVISAEWYGMDGAVYSGTHTFTESVIETASASQPVLRDQS
ncbi:MAG: hypothetical protein D6732_03985 [Methanobacteriota archaeon]|nr:MAG: hypothetical protein D6732_03985 [Euryarchaeota archaeon]